MDRAGDHRARAQGVLRAIGQVPIVVRRELDGFVLNRLQGALLSEAMRLVGEGYVSPADLDKTVRDGLGLRWSFMGPFATIELNAPGGVADYCARYGGFFRRLAADPPAPAIWDEENARRRRRDARAAPRANRGHGDARDALARSAPDGAGRAQTRTESDPNRRQRWTIMTEKRKVIITCAVTGSIHTPSMSPYLPVTPQEIADAAVGAAEAGAAIVHLHARDPVDGHPTQDPKYFRDFAADITRRSDVVINFTTGGAATMTIEERLQPALQLKPEVASLNMGSMNFGLYPDAEALQRRSSTTGSATYLATSDDRIFKNTFKDIEYILTSCADNGTRFEIECYDIGHLYTARAFPRSRDRQAAALHPERVRHPRRHRRASRTTSRT